MKGPLTLTYVHSRSFPSIYRGNIHVVIIHNFNKIITGFVQVLEVLGSTLNSSLFCQDLEILEQQHIFGQGA